MFLIIPLIINEVFLVDSIDFSKFDISLIIKPENDPYVSDVNSSTIIFNVQTVLPLTDTCSFENCIATVEKSKDCECYGKLNTESSYYISDNSGFDITYSASALGRKHTVLYRVLCDSREDYLITLNGGDITVLFYSKGGCRKEEPLSFGSIALIIIACLIVLYFLIGIPIMYFCFKKRGIEMIPFVYFWISIPTLVYYGISFLFRPCCNKKQGFETVI